MLERNIIRGEKIEPTLVKSLGELTLILLKVYQNNILLISAETGEKLSSKALINKAACLARWFKSKGLKRNDIYSINSENCLEYGIVTLSGLFSNICCAPLNPEYTQTELEHVINLSKPKIVFCSPSTIEKMCKLAEKCSNIEHLVVFGEKTTQIQQNKLITYFEDIIKGVSTDLIDETFVVDEVNTQDTLAAILCSSGTTGLPKGVMIMQSNVITFLEIARKLFDFSEKIVQTGVSIALAPYFHSLGFMQLIINLIRGMQVIVMKKFKPHLFLEVIGKYKVTDLIVPPPIILFLTKNPLVKNYDLSSLKNVKCGAAPMSSKMELEVERQFSFSLSQGYGMTETTLGVLTIRDDKRPGSVGLIVPEMMCKVIDEEGNALGPNQEGELCFKGPLVMKGYIGDSEATAIAIDKENWLHTGDIGYYDEEFFFYIVDRVKELIKYKAFQVAPAELEGLLLSHPTVFDAAVVGLPDEEAGELPLAFIVRKPGCDVSETEIQNFVASKVSSQKKLRGGVRFVNEIPKNPSGKILRRELKQRAKTLVSKL